MYRIRKIGVALAGYINLEVFPPEGMCEESKARRIKGGGDGQVLYDRLSIPYGSISKVLLSVKQPNGKLPEVMDPAQVRIQIGSMANSALQVHSPEASQEITSTIIEDMGSQT